MLVTNSQSTHAQRDLTATQQNNGRKAPVSSMQGNASQMKNINVEMQLQI